MLKFSLSLHMPDPLGRHPADHPDAIGQLRRGSPLETSSRFEGLNGYEEDGEMQRSSFNQEDYQVDRRCRRVANCAFEEDDTWRQSLIFPLRSVLFAY